MAYVEVGETYVHPNSFPGATITERLNAMSATAPIGAIGFVPKGIILSKTAGTDYGVWDRCRISWHSDANQRAPIWYDDSFAGAKVWKVRPEPPIYAALGREIGSLRFNPYPVTSMTWNPGDPVCSWCARVMSFEYPEGHGEARLWMHDVYAPFGSEAAIVIEGIDGQAGMFSSVIDRLYSDGGVKITGMGGQPGGFGDSIVMNSPRLDGMFGLDLSLMAGAGECAVNDLQGGTLGGPTIRVRRGNKISFSRLNIEQKGWIDSIGGPTRRVIDIACSELSGAAMLNGLEISGTVSNHTGLPFANVVYVDRAFLSQQRRLNVYSPVGLVDTMIEYGPNCEYPMVMQPATYNGNFTNKIVIPAGTKPYGHKVGPQYWNPPFSPQTNMSIQKSIDGIVTISGVAIANAKPSNGTVIFGLPNGFRAYKEVAIPVLSDTGPCFMVAAPQTDESNGHPVSVENVPVGATRFRLAGSFPEWHHANGIETNN